MSTTSFYHLLPEDNRPSEGEDAVDDESLPAPLHDNLTPPNERSGHATIYTRFGAICLLIPAFVILIIPITPETLSVEILGMICVVRNALILLFHVVSTRLRITVEFVGRSTSPH